MLRRIKFARLKQRRAGVAGRPASFPFISGDTFRSVADAIFEGGSIAWEHLPRPGHQVKVVFSEPRHVRDASEWMTARTGKAVLVVHNGDLVDERAVIEAARSFVATLCVNWLSDSGGITPIPIGVENLHLRMNGRLELYAPGLPSRRHRLAGLSERDINVLLAFNVATNPAERSAALNAFSGQRGCVVINDRISPEDHRDLLLRSKFVISPPGNGPDCHRTWESIYCGAVPVVLRKAWPFQALDLPVVQVDDWVLARELILADGSDLFEWARQASTDAAFFPWYDRRIFDSLDLS